MSAQSGGTKARLRLQAGPGEGEGRSWARPVRSPAVTNDDWRAHGLGLKQSDQLRPNAHSTSMERFLSTNSCLFVVQSWLKLRNCAVREASTCVVAMGASLAGTASALLSCAALLRRKPATSLFRALPPHAALTTALLIQEPDASMVLQLSARAAKDAVADQGQQAWDNAALAALATQLPAVQRLARMRIQNVQLSETALCQLPRAMLLHSGSMQAVELVRAGTRWRRAHTAVHVHCAPAQPHKPHAGEPELRGLRAALH